MQFVYGLIWPLLTSSLNCESISATHFRAEVSEKCCTKSRQNGGKVNPKDQKGTSLVSHQFQNMKFEIYHQIIEEIHSTRERKRSVILGKLKERFEG